MSSSSSSSTFSTSTSSSSSSIPRLSASVPHPLPFGATSTTTLSTTASATIGAVLHLTIPTASSPHPTPYTLLPVPTSPGAKFYPDGLPVLVLTQVDAVVFDVDGGRVLSTVTAVQRAPDATGSVKTEGASAVIGNGWAGWTKAQMDGVIVAGVLVAAIVAGMLVWCLQRRGVWQRRGERKMRRMRERRKKWWRDLRDEPRSIGKGVHKAARRERKRLGSDDEERAEAWKRSMREAPRRPEEMKDGTERGRAVVRAVRQEKARTVAGRNHGPAEEAYEMSDAVRRPDSFNQIQQQALIPQYIPCGQRDADTPPDSGSSGKSLASRDTSKYRAWRAQQRRAENARPGLENDS
ncbi:MAG: hypothetical protein LQ346_000507 [Caloplaca aetnensis]|nr:MAG: hypothetical protein LQ346_000507 [Caloplaca aetnensis]